MFGCVVMCSRSGAGNRDGTEVGTRFSVFDLQSLININNLDNQNFYTPIIITIPYCVHLLASSVSCTVISTAIVVIRFTKARSEKVSNRRLLETTDARDM